LYDQSSYTAKIIRSLHLKLSHQTKYLKNLGACNRSTVKSFELLDKFTSLQDPLWRIVKAQLIALHHPLRVPASCILGEFAVLSSLISVGTLQNGYIRNVPLPRVPRVQSASIVTVDHEPTPTTHSTCYLQVPRVPTWSAIGGLGKKQLLPLFPRWLM